MRGLCARIEWHRLGCVQCPLGKRLETEPANISNPHFQHELHDPAGLRLNKSVRPGLVAPASRRRCCAPWKKRKPPARRRHYQELIIRDTDDDFRSTRMLGRENCGLGSY